MTNKRVARLTVLVLAAPMTAGLACLVRDWSVCTPQDHCKTGFVCTEDFRCVPAPEAGTTDGVIDGVAGNPIAPTVPRTSQAPTSRLQWDQKLAEMRSAQRQQRPALRLPSRPMPRAQTLCRYQTPRAP
jgi:hypothetical protein